MLIENASPLECLPGASLRVPEKDHSPNSLCLSSPFRREQFAASKGARNTAKKFLVVVTDGEKTGDPLEYTEVVQEADRAGVTRFAVGVRANLLSVPKNTCIPNYIIPNDSESILSRIIQDMLF